MSLLVFEYERKYIELSQYAEHSLKGPRVAVEPSKGTPSMSGFRSRDYRRYTLGMSSNQDFKGHYGGPSSRQYNSGSTSQRKS
ncbi:hypothetical protein E5676_scaffold263G00540 [Cucumis melo var. makuwa]|uniref:Uncharacterized protein n=1 Tax=Cucumis melo var. makuwa TaxID=1194695 RepID=A0A5D3CMZ6_CUCMM|nr:hypothetical protein E6C27_scaffold19G001010 [Cucumis melo var. makuwa]TYK11609.1 hypothetical protein E5676_scaffold263G00540 [Cucumis melo var. makuwa]